MKIATIIIPTYNEKDTIAVTIDEVKKVTSKIKDWQVNILVVDDTSPDKTYEIVEAIAKKDSSVRLLVNKVKAGLGGAYLKGMEMAFGEMNSDVAFEFDADLSHDPTKLPIFLNKIDAGADFVIGSRYIKGGGIPSDWGVDRKFLSVVGNWFIMLVLTNFSIHDWTSGYRAITKKVYEAVHPYLHSERFFGYTFQIGFLYNTVLAKFKVVEVPFVFKDRTAGKSKMGPEYIKNTLLYILKVRAKEILNNRIFKFLVVGSIGAFTQLISLQIFRALLTSSGDWQLFGLFSSFQVATFLAIELAVAANFTLSNLWTFADRALKLKEIPAKFLQFNLASSGSIIIQLIFALIAEKLIGLRPLFTLPIIDKVIDTGLIFGVIGILIGMFWNFFAYSKIVWKKKK